MTGRPVGIFALPGGSYSRRYFDLQIRGHKGYSEAEYHADKGSVFVAIDHLGVGESTTAGLASMTVEELAAANDAAVRQMVARLAEGKLADGFPPIPNLFKVGIGQSMGGCLTVIMQGRHATYDAIVPLGFSAIYPELKDTPWHEIPYRRGDDMTHVAFAYDQVPVSQMSYLFHWDDVPRDIVEADMSEGFPLRKTPQHWTSATIPNCALAMTSPGYVDAEAAVIDVPILVVAGERDATTTPLKEPEAYKKATDVSVFIVPRMGHMHNFASTRAMLWARTASWARMVASASRS